MVVMDDLSLLPDARHAIENIVEEELTPAQLKLKAGIKELGKKCQEIIRLFYFHRYSIAAIAEDLGYSNENVVRSHKSRCLKKLKTMIK